MSKITNFELAVTLVFLVLFIFVNRQNEQLKKISQKMLKISEDLRSVKQKHKSMSDKVPNLKINFQNSDKHISKVRFEDQQTSQKKISPPMIQSLTHSLPNSSAENGGLMFQDMKSKKHDAHTSVTSSSRSTEPINERLIGSMFEFDQGISF